MGRWTPEESDTKLREGSGKLGGRGATRADLDVLIRLLPGAAARATKKKGETAEEEKRRSSRGRWVDVAGTGQEDPSDRRKSSSSSSSRHKVHSGTGKWKLQRSKATVQCESLQLTLLSCGVLTTNPPRPD
uniref:Uncharacterized protein n=1 Tax=Oryza brachyantha TaxID=4533 RepID=J3N2U4_ORYBR